METTKKNDEGTEDELQVKVINESVESSNNDSAVTATQEKKLKKKKKTTKARFCQCQPSWKVGKMYIYLY